MVILNPVTLSWKINHWRTIRASTSGSENDRRVGIRRLRNGKKKEKHEVRKPHIFNNEDVRNRRRRGQACSKA